VDDFKELVAKHTFRSHGEIVTSRGGENTMALGDARWAMIDSYLARCKCNQGKKLVLSDDQSTMFAAFKRAVIPHLYTHDVFDRYATKILRRRNQAPGLPGHRWDRLEQNVLCVASRRVGKTYALSIFLSAFALACPGQRIVIMSTGGRASDWMLDTVMWFMVQFPETKRRLVMRKETLSVLDRPLAPGTSIKANKHALSASTTTHITSLPDNPDKCRGVTASLFVIDEAGHMSPNMFQVACVPLLLIKHTAMMAITTPGPEYDYFAEIMDIRNDAGESFARAFRFGRVCHACAKIGKSLSCTHRKDKVREHWHSDERFEWVKRIQMRTDKDKFISETLGVYTRKDNRLFDIEWIDTFRHRVERTPFEFKHPVSLITVGIDPAGGSKASRYAIVSVAHHMTHRVVRTHQFTSLCIVQSHDTSSGTYTSVQFSSLCIVQSHGTPFL